MLSAIVVLIVGVAATVVFICTIGISVVIIGAVPTTVGTVCRVSFESASVGRLRSG